MRAHANAHSRPIVHSRDAEMISIVKSNINLTFNEHKKKTQALTTTIKQKVCKAHNSQQYNWPAMSRIQEEEVESKKTRTIVEKWLSEGKKAGAREYECAWNYAKQKNYVFFSVADENNYISVHCNNSYNELSR